MLAQRLFCALPLALFGLLLSGAAGGAEELRTGAVEVMATRVARELQDVPMSVSVITNEEIRKNPARTVGELLQDVPGVEILNSGAQGLKRISIRGEQPNRVLILIDGQKIVENKSMDGTPVMIDPSTIERVEVIKGPASVLYGSEAMGGVVNVITKKGGRKPVQGEASLTYSGASNGLTESGSLYGSYKGFNYRISGSNSMHGDLYTPNGYMHNTGYTQSGGSAFLSYDFFEKLTVGGGVERFFSDINSASMEPGYEKFFVDIPKWQRDKAYAFVEAKNLTSWLPRLRLDVFNQKNEKKMHNHVETEGMPMIMDNYADNTNYQWGASLQVDWQLGANNYLITGYDYNFDRLEADTVSSAKATGAVGEALTTMKGVYEKMPASRRPAIQKAIESMESSLNYHQKSRHEGWMETHAAYAQLESMLPGDFTLTLGARYTGVQSKMTTARGNKTLRTFGTGLGVDVGEEASSFNGRPVFNAGLMWSGIEDLTLRATFSQGFRVPSLQEKYVLSAMGGGIIEPNPDLEPETSNTFELGARYLHKGFMTDLALFYSHARDYIAQQTVDADQQLYRYMNVAAARTYGAELAVHYELPYGFTPYASATWMRREYDYGDWKTWKSGSPELTGRAGIRYEKALTKDVTFHADAFTRFNTQSDLEEGDRDDKELTHYAGWATANLAAGITFGDEKQYSLTGEVLNITNTPYRLNSAIEEPGLSANIKLSVSF